MAKTPKTAATTQLAVLTAASLAGLSSTELSALTTTDLATLSATDVDSLTETQLAALTPEQLEALTAPDLDDEDDPEPEPEPEPAPARARPPVGQRDTDAAQAERIADAAEMSADPYAGMTDAERRAAYELDNPRTITGLIAKALREPGISIADINHLNALSQQFAEIKNRIAQISAGASVSIMDELDDISRSI